jgi:hypothetical protein
MTDAITVRSTKALVRHLLTDALEYLEVGSGEAAIWRLIDAAGLLGQLSPQALGIYEATGMGFQLLDTQKPVSSGNGVWTDDATTR